MDAVEFREYCLGKPNTIEGMPFGETVLVFKVAGKMFALVSLDELPATVNLKCDPDLALESRDGAGHRRRRHPTASRRAGKAADPDHLHERTDRIQVHDSCAFRKGLVWRQPFRMLRVRPISLLSGQ